jgi:REP element-mobilizing transposase RayT
MPDHVHIVINIKGEGTLDLNMNNKLGIYKNTQKNKEGFGRPIPGSIPTIVRSFKSAVTYQINKKMGTHGQKIWQRNYYERIIPTEREYQKVERYILNNPTQ